MIFFEFEFSFCQYMYIQEKEVMALTVQKAPFAVLRYILGHCLGTPLSVSQVLNSHSHVMYILSILLAKYTEIKVSLKSRKTMD